MSAQDANQAAKESDDGTLRLTETPNNYFVRGHSRQHSAQALAQTWLNRQYEVRNMDRMDYETRIRELNQAIRLGVDPATSCTDGIVASLRQLNAAGWLVGDWHFVSIDCDHFASEAWEIGFACCYRNAQTMLSALFHLPEFRKRLFGSLSSMPSVWKLQALLESAWQSGFDPAGAAQIAEVTGRRAAASAGSQQSSSGVFGSGGGEPVGLVDSTAWLGATDLAALLGSVGVRCCLVECTTSSGPDNTHPKLFDHIYSYIRASEHAESDNNAPLIYSLPMYLQHEGHSRIVTGVQVDTVTQKPVALMVLDPNIPVEAMRLVTEAANVASVGNPPPVTVGHMHGQRRMGIENAGGNNQQVPLNSWDQVLDRMRLEVCELCQPQYQLLQMDGLINDEMDLQDAMIPENIAIAI